MDPHQNRKAEVGCRPPPRFGIHWSVRRKAILSLTFFIDVDKGVAAPTSRSECLDFLDKPFVLSKLLDALLNLHCLISTQIISQIHKVLH
jgi:hypothetical protein